MARRARYQANNSYGDGFGGFMKSTQIQMPLRLLGADMAAEAAATDGTDIADQYDTEDGPLVTVAGNPRTTQRVVNRSEKAAAYEFGSGEQGEGASGASPRPQGGSSPARRHLGYIAAGYHTVIGEPG